MDSTALNVVLQENERTKDLIIEQRFHRAIIGQKGEKIKEVRDKFPDVSLKLLIVVDVCLFFFFFPSSKRQMCFSLFKVIINFPDPAQKSDIVQLRGPRNEVEKCSKFMQKIVAEMVSIKYILSCSLFRLFSDNLIFFFFASQVENSHSVSVPIFKQFHRNIIGKGGSNIKKVLISQGMDTMSVNMWPEMLFFFRLI